MNNNPQDNLEENHLGDAGYKNPPERNRFQKGKSGNPNGRPKKSMDTLSSLISKVLEEKIQINEGPKKSTITKKEALAKTLVNNAISGKPGAAKTLQPYIDKTEKPPPRRIFLVEDIDRTEENRKKIEESMRNRNSDPENSEES